MTRLYCTECWEWYHGSPMQDEDGEHIFICPTCFEKKTDEHLKKSRTKKASKEVETTTSEGKKVRRAPGKPIVVDRNKLTYAEYQRLEYDVESDMRNYSRKERLHVLRELLDIALLGKDFEWIKALVRRMQIVERAIADENE